MSDPRTHAAPGSSDFTELWKTVSKLCHRDHNTGKQMPATAMSPVCKDFQSPGRRGSSKYHCLNNGDSPGDVEVSQDIVWDSTSPIQANTGSGHRNTRIVAISDIVNRIAPEDAKPKGTESPFLQWIGIPCTPEISRPRLKKKSSRQSSVDDLMKLAKQFDENMQHDQETSGHLNTVNNNLNEYVNISDTKLTEPSFPCNVKDLKSPSSLDRVEAELHALFDSSTQRVSGRLSECSAASACSQDIKDQPVTSALAEHQQSELRSADRSGSTAHPSEEKGSCAHNPNNCDSFDDDWENDDLLNDSLVLAMNQNPCEQHDTKTKTTAQHDTNKNSTQFTPVCKPTANTEPTHQSSNLHCKPSISVLCPKPKTTNRNTFKLEPNPHFQAKMAKEVSGSSFTVVQPKSQMSDQISVTTKISSAPQSDRVNNDHSGSHSRANSGKDISDSLWDDGDDDALLYQVCDNLERIPNSQPQQTRSSNCQEKQDIAVDSQRKTTVSLPIDTAWSVNAGASTKRQSPCAFVRSNSLPGTSCETVNYEGWNIPMKGANNKSRMSQSFPGSHMSLGTFSQRKDSSGTFQAGNANVDMKPHTVTARAPQNSKSHHTAFKRNVSDSAAGSNKVFVTSQTRGKCSAAEIERKKQEALARRRLRMQNISKP